MVSFINGDSKWTRYDAASARLLGFTNAVVLGDDSESRDDPSCTVIYRNTGLPNNPMFAIGNPYVAGIGLNAGGIWYTDDSLNGVWKIILSFEQSGTFASVLDGVRRSCVESFLNNGDHKPFMRIESSSQAVQIGSGGFLVAPGGAVRAAGVLTLTTTTIGGFRQVHKMGVGQALLKQPVPGYLGDTTNFGFNGALWGPGATAMTVASVVDQYTITVVDARANATNVDWLSFSCEPAGDVEFGRDDYGVAAIRTKSGTRCQFTEAGVLVPSGLSVLGAGSSLQLGSAGIGVLELTADTVHVQNGKTFFNEGTYKSTGWYNGGGETQTTQEVFNVGTGGGAVSTYLRQINGVDWMVLRVLNDGQTGAGNDLTILPHSGDTIGYFGSGTGITIPAYSGVTLISNGTDWKVLYSPPFPGHP